MPSSRLSALCFSTNRDCLNMSQRLVANEAERADVSPRPAGRIGSLLHRLGYLNRIVMGCARDIPSQRPTKSCYVYENGKHGELNIEFHNLTNPSGYWRAINYFAEMG